MQALEAKPFIWKALGSTGQQALEAKQVLLYYCCTFIIQLYYCRTAVLLLAVLLPY